METLVVNDASSDERLTLAGEMLQRCSGVVVLDGVARLIPGRREIECAVTGPKPGYPRCEEEYKVMVENAARALESSRLCRHLPDRPLRWAIVADESQGSIELWRAEDN
jgi:hypothetical protein